jgi:hypothetical protein
MIKLWKKSTKKSNESNKAAKLAKKDFIFEEEPKIKRDRNVNDSWLAAPEVENPNKKSRKASELAQHNTKLLPEPTRILQNWWIVSNCVTGLSYCSGTSHTGNFCVTQPFRSRALQPGDTVSVDRQDYTLGIHSADPDQMEDNFGPWPQRMKSTLNAVHLQFRSLQSDSITDFSSQMAMKVDGTRLDHLSTTMLLFNTLKVVNATETRKIIGRAMLVRI